MLKRNIAETGALEQDFAPLVTAAQNGSQDAFTQIVQQFYGMVYAVTLAQLRSPEVAEELTQEVFVRVHLHLHKLREPNALAGWLRRIARNEAFRWYSRRQTRSELHSFISLEEVGSDVMDTESASPREQAADREQLAALRAALDKLPAAQREILLLHYIEGQSKSEVARTLGIHHATVGRQIDRITAGLRDQLAPFAGKPLAAVTGSSRGLSRTIAACAAVAALNTTERSAMAGQFATTMETAGAAKTGGAVFGSLFASTTAKLLIPAAIAVAGTATVATHYWPAQAHAPKGDAAFEEVLRQPAPADYIVQVRPSKLAPTEVREDDVLNASRQIVNTYTSFDKDGAGKDGFKTAIYGLPVSTTFAILRAVPAWSVDQLSQSNARVDTVVRTPAFPELGRQLVAPGTDPEKVYGPFFSEVSSKVCDRFLAQAGLQIASRPVSVPHVRICAPNSPGARLDYSSTATASTRVLHSWDKPVDLDTIALTFLVKNHAPVILEIDPAVKHKMPAHWNGKLDLPDGASPTALGQLLSYAYDLPYEVTSKESTQWLLYEPATSSAQVEQWKTGATSTPRQLAAKGD